jgi:general secretion pathway protein F
MNYDELAFVNQQLAGMLRDGLPLEGSLRQLGAQMQRGRLRAELRLLESDLAKGVPLAAALAGRKLPQFYVRMMQVGARSNDLPGVLTLLADYYQSANATWTRLKGLMVYPAIVLVLSTALSFWIATLFAQIFSGFGTGWTSRGLGGLPMPGAGQAHLNFESHLWLPPLILAALATVALLAVSLPSLRRNLVWRVPAFKEASLSRFASAMAILLKSGCPLGDALELLGQMERGSRASSEVARWKKRCADGHAKFSDVADGSKIFPPMFVWLVAGAGEDLATGFQRAAQVYQARAVYRTEVLLYAALPAALLLLGLMILSQIYPFAHLIFGLPNLFRF